MSRKTNLKPIYRYALRDFLTGGIIVCGALAAITVVLIIAENTHSGGRMELNGASLSLTIMMFVFGIVEPRPYLRLSAQFGVSRRTAFTGMNFAAFTGAALLAVTMEVLTGITKLCNGLNYREFYQITYLHGADAMTVSQHLTSIVLNIVLMMALFFLGMIFTTLFWRLNKIGIIFAVAVMVLLANGLPVICVRNQFGQRIAAVFFRCMSRSVWNLAIFFIIFAAVAAVISWLLIRTANIKAPAGK